MVDLHIGFRVLKACLAFPGRALMSSPVPPVTDAMLPRHLSTCFSSFPFRVVCLLVDCLSSSALFCPH